MLKKLVFVLALIMMISIGYGAVSTVTVSSPTAEPYYTSNTTPTMTVTSISNTTLINATIFGNFTGSYVANTSNQTTVTNNTAFNIYTNALITGEYNWTVEVCDNDNDCVRAGDMTVIVDVTDPSIGSVVNTNLSGTTDMTAQVNSTITETNKDSCWGRVYASNHTYLDKLDGVMESTICILDITASDIDVTGQFTIGINANDSAGNTATEVNSTNWTKVTLYAGWNLIHMGENLSLSGIAEYSESITSTSYYYNSNHSYVTYVSGASSNENLSVEDGDAVYVYANTTLNLLRFWSVDMPVKNITLTSGWNQIALQNSTTNTLTQVCALTLDTGATDMMTTSFVDMSKSVGSRYEGHPCLLSIGGSVEVPKGYGVWVNVNGTTTMELART